jgi:hypothetical protein
MRREVKGGVQRWRVGKEEKKEKAGGKSKRVVVEETEVVVLRWK